MNFLRVHIDSYTKVSEQSLKFLQNPKSPYPVSRSDRHFADLVDGRLKMLLEFLVHNVVSVLSVTGPAENHGIAGRRLVDLPGVADTKE